MQIIKANKDTAIISACAPVCVCVCVCVCLSADKNKVNTVMTFGQGGVVQESSPSLTLSDNPAITT